VAGISAFAGDSRQSSAIPAGGEPMMRREID
jgi:hypothetical protein